MSNQSMGTCELCGASVPCPTCIGPETCPVYLSEADMGVVSEILCSKAQELEQSANFTKNPFAKELSTQVHTLCGKFNKARKELREESESEQNRVPQRSLG
jgi:hypothetical protein